MITTVPFATCHHFRLAPRQRCDALCGLWDDRAQLERHCSSETCRARQVQQLQREHCVGAEHPSGLPLSRLAQPCSILLVPQSGANLNPSGFCQGLPGLCLQGQGLQGRARAGQGSVLGRRTCSNLIGSTLVEAAHRCVAYSFA